MRSTRRRPGAASRRRSISSRKRVAAVIGPIVWELDGPMPILKRSKTERNTGEGSDGAAPRTSTARRGFAELRLGFSPPTCSDPAGDMRSRLQVHRNHRTADCAARRAKPWR